MILLNKNYIPSHNGKDIEKAYKAISQLSKKTVLVKGLLNKKWGFPFEDRVKKAGQQVFDSLVKFSEDRIAEREKETTKKKERQTQQESTQKKTIKIYQL